MKVEDSGHGISKEKEEKIKNALDGFDFAFIASPEIREIGKE